MFALPRIVQASLFQLLGRTGDMGADEGIFGLGIRSRPQADRCDRPVARKEIANLPINEMAVRIHLKSLVERRRPRISSVTDTLPSVIPGK